MVEVVEKIIEMWRWETIECDGGGEGKQQKCGGGKNRNVLLLVVMVEK